MDRGFLEKCAYKFHVHIVISVDRLSTRFYLNTSKHDTGSLLADPRHYHSICNLLDTITITVDPVAITVEFYTAVNIVFYNPIRL